jgi:RimJ/RimL family protein N-acetyltransferase
MPDDLYKTILRNGETVYFRFLKQKDKEWIKAGYKSLSYKSQYFRFISPPREISEKDLRYLTEIDFKNHVAIVAVAVRESGKLPLGVARYIKISESPCSAEFAITIVDPYQNMGIGTIFLKLLVEHARNNDICNLIGYVLSENIAMIKILEHYNITRQKEEGSMLRITLSIQDEQ